jgi:hypothetical protein
MLYACQARQNVHIIAQVGIRQVCEEPLRLLVKLLGLGKLGLIQAGPRHHF